MASIVDEQGNMVAPEEWAAWKRRMVRFFSFYDANRTEDDIDELLTHYAARPSGFIEMLKDMIQRYGPEPEEADVLRAFWRRKLEAFYLVIDDPQLPEDIDECLDFFENSNGGYEEMWQRVKEHFHMRIGDSVAGGRSSRSTSVQTKGTKASAVPDWKITDIFKSNPNESAVKHGPNSTNGAVVPKKPAPESSHPDDVDDAVVIAPKVKVLLNIAGISFAAFLAAGADSQLRFNSVVASVARAVGAFPNMLIASGVTGSSSGRDSICMTLQTVLPDSARVCGSILIHAVHGGTFPMEQIKSASAEHLRVRAADVEVNGAAVVESRMTGGFLSTVTIADDPFESPLGVLGDYKLPTVEESRQLALLRRTHVDEKGQLFSYKLPVKDSRSAYEPHQTKSIANSDGRGYVPSVPAYMNRPMSTPTGGNVSERSESASTTRKSAYRGGSQHAGGNSYARADSSSRAREVYERRLYAGGM